jgi:hypothetical protein
MVYARLLLIVVGFLAFSGAIHFVSVEANAQQAEVNADGKFFGIAGWAQKEQKTGTVFYMCRTEICGEDSTVSLHLHNFVGLNASDVLANEMRVKEYQTKALKGALKEVILDQPKIQEGSKFRTGVVHRTNVPVSSKTKLEISPFWTTGFVEAKGKTFTISSSAMTRELANKNFELFQIAAGNLLAAGKIKK